MFSNLTHIMGRGIEINLGPNGPPGKIHRTFISIHVYIAFPYGTFRIGIIIAQGLEAVNKTAQPVENPFFPDIIGAENACASRIFFGDRLSVHDVSETALRSWYDKDSR